MAEPDDLDGVRARVRARYTQAATAVAAGGVAACGETCGGEDEAGTGSSQYASAELGQVPADAVAASLGCGNPLAVADLRAGETVLDLGSGGGIDVLLSARRVGPSGWAYGLDMTREMLELARANAAKAGAANVEFLQGHIEAIPLPSATVDVIISNCVINLSGDKQTVLAESFRVLRPGGRLGVSDILADDDLSEAERLDRGRQVGCLAGALSFAEYRDGLSQAGFTNVRITPTHQVADGLHSAIIQAAKPRP
jgi:arsenite methyltransferase